MNPFILSLGLAIQPLSILAVVLFLTSENGRGKAVALAAGWASVLALVAAATVVLGSQVSTPPSSTSSKVSAIVDIVLGALLLVLALRQRAKNNGVEEPARPEWMGRLDKMSPILAFGLGMFLPTYVLAAAVANDIIRHDYSTTGTIIAVAVFVVIASLGVATPLLVVVLRPKQADATLASWRHWLETHWPQVAFWILVVFGVYLAVKGVVELFH